MKPVFLFDWGDTLMVDLPEMEGKMCDWPRIEVIDGAAQTLSSLAEQYDIYIATGAEESDAHDIQQVFQRAELDQYIKGYFCPKVVGLRKGSPAFLLRILMLLRKPPQAVTVVGDSLKRDIEPAMAIGMKVVWFRNHKPQVVPSRIKAVDNLIELLELSSSPVHC